MYSLDEPWVAAKGSHQEQKADTWFENIEKHTIRLAIRDSIKIRK
jgi:hypothetical protein